MTWQARAAGAIGRQLIDRQEAGLGKNGIIGAGRMSLAEQKTVSVGVLRILRRYVEPVVTITARAQ